MSDKQIFRGWSSALLNVSTPPPTSGTSSPHFDLLFEVGVRPSTNEESEGIEPFGDNQEGNNTTISNGATTFQAKTVQSSPKVIHQDKQSKYSKHGFTGDSKKVPQEWPTRFDPFGGQRSIGLGNAKESTISPTTTTTEQKRLPYQSSSMIKQSFGKEVTPSFAKLKDSTPVKESSSGLSPQHEIDLASKGRVASLVEKFQTNRPYPDYKKEPKLSPVEDSLHINKGDYHKRTNEMYPSLQANRLGDTSFTKKEQGNFESQLDSHIPSLEKKKADKLFRTIEDKNIATSKLIAVSSIESIESHPTTTVNIEEITKEDLNVISEEQQKEQQIKNRENVKKLLKLDSCISDDGYNVIAPISQPYTGLNVKDSTEMNENESDIDERPNAKTQSKKKKKRVSMYDWATAEKSNYEESFDTIIKQDTLIRSASQKSSKTVRQIPIGSVNRSAHFPPIHVFVGTWNTEYGEFPMNAMLSDTSPDLPVVSLPSIDQNIFSTGNMVGNSISQNQQIRESILLDLNMQQEDFTKKNVSTIQNDTSRLIEDTKKSIDSGIAQDLIDDDDRITSESDIEGDTITDNIEALKAFRNANIPPTKNSVLADKIYQPLPNDREPFADWISSGYDVYVIALQEVVSDRLFEAIVIYLNRINKKKFQKMNFTEDKISGLGDGAYLSMKSTSISCFVAEDVLGETKPVNVGSSKGMSLNSLNGSKGAVSIILTIYGQVICFVSCHLPAGKPDSRYKARDVIRRRLAEAYCGYSDVNPTDVFHHIVWAGDFNLRIQEIPASVVLDHLYQGDYQSILAFDEFQYQQYSQDFIDDGFEEAGITFYPTYKKIVGRSPLDKTDPYWLHKEYNIHFKVKWYKGGKIKERVPSWTDRIFKWSQPALRSCLLFLPDTYDAATPSFDTILLSSDHNPVGCGFILCPLSRQYKLPPVMFYEKDQTVKKKKNT